VITASTAVGNGSPSVQVIGQARGAAYYIWELIDRVKSFKYYFATKAIR
jgi:hypothetical protein